MKTTSPKLRQLGVVCFWIGIAIAVYLIGFVAFGLAFQEPWAEKSAFLSVPSAITAIGLGRWVRYRFGWRA